MSRIAYVKTERHPDLPPPPSEKGVIKWVREKLFSTWYDALGTFAVLYLLYLAIPAAIDWMFVYAVWEAQDNKDCLPAYTGTKVGACWGFIDARFNQFMYGFYNPNYYWRPNLVGLTLLVTLIPILFGKLPNRVGAVLFGAMAAGWLVVALTSGEANRVTIDATLGMTVVLGLVAYMCLRRPARIVSAIFAIAAFPWLAIALLHGPINIQSMQSTLGAVVYLLLFLGGGYLGWSGQRNLNPGRAFLGFGTAYVVLVFAFLTWGFNLPVEPTNRFGGLLLTLVLAVTAISASLPIGILLALGRRASNLPLVQMLCIGFIELIRAVPLITILFMGQFMLPLFLPEGVNFDNLVRAMVALTLFTAAYMAEVVRGGLQAIMKGQYEAADALGFDYWMSMRLIILPQALKIVIPGIVSIFIGIFKDTTLVSIIGLLDLLLITKTAVTSSQWLGMEHTGYVFVAIIYWIFCFGMSRYSIYLEGQLHTGHKR